MKARFLVLPAVLPFVAVAVACGGADSTELFAAAGDTGTQPSSSGDPGTTSSSSSSSSGSTSSSSSGSSGTTTKDGGTTTKKDSGTDSSTPPPPTPPPTHTISCGEANGQTVTCDATSQVCCANLAQNKPTFTCKPDGAGACTGATTIACDDRTDCGPNEICCGMYVTGVGYDSIQCRSSCDSTPGVRGVHFCDPNAKVDECLDFGGVCKPSQSVPGYYVCGQ